MTNCNEIYYFIPLFPFLTRSFIVVYFHSLMSASMSIEESDRDTHRSYILAMSGFSFTGLLALAIVNAEITTNLDLPVFYLLISFLCYFFALNLQGYKFYRWHDQLSNALIESASLSIILTIVAIIIKAKGITAYSMAIVIISISIWLIDNTIRLLLSYSYFKNLQASGSIKN